MGKPQKQLWSLPPPAHGTAMFSLGVSPSRFLLRVWTVAVKTGVHTMQAWPHLGRWHLQVRPGFPLCTMGGQSHARGGQVNTNLSRHKSQATGALLPTGWLWSWLSYHRISEGRDISRSTSLLATHHSYSILSSKLQAEEPLSLF